MSCLPCTEPVFCACTPSQTCSFIGRSCETCVTAVCTERASPAVQSTTASTVGGALGGVLGILVGIGLVYWFWWKPRGLAASRKRYSRHLSARQSKLMSGGGAGEKKLHLSASNPTSPTGVSKRTSVHLRMENVEESLSRRNTGVSPYLDDVGSNAATGHRTPGSIDSTSDNPFADNARLSLAASTRTSEFSFRSSHSTNIIPIAYIPPHSSSLSVDDTNRGAFGEEDGGRLSAYGGMRGSVPVSMASRDSLGNAVNVVEMNLLAPIASPDSSHNTYRVSTSGAPIRPPRSPGLDLQLPKPSPITSPLASPLPPISRPRSGFPWDLAPPQRPELVSAFSTSSLVLPAPNGLNPGSSDRGLSVLLEPNTGKQSHLSVFSTASSDSSRSGNSTLSYILDPPQIITPVNPTGLRRVMGREVAGLVRLNGSGSLAGSPAGSSNPTTPVLSSPLSANDSTVNPFSDDADVNATPKQPFLSADRTSTQSNSTIGSFSNNEARWTAASSDGGDQRRDTGTSFAPSFVIQTASTVDLGDMPTSASDHSTPGINDGFEKGGETIRYTTGGLLRTSSLTRNGEGSSRESYASTSKGTDSMSMLDGIPFVAPSNFSSASTSLASRPHSSASSFNDNRDDTSPPLRSPLFPVPQNRLSNPISSPATIRATSNGSLLKSMHYEDEAGDLPAPFLPFAGQRPTSASTIGGMSFAPRGMSTDMSIRSGFGSGLDGIPFQLGFPGGMEGGSERNSVMTVDSFADAEGSVRDSMVSVASSAGNGREEQGNRLLVGNGRPSAQSSNISLVSSSDASFVTAASPSLQTKNSCASFASTTAPSAPSVRTIEDDPFGRHAEIGAVLETDRKEVRDSTSSIDTLALSAELARNLVGED